MLSTYRIEQRSERIASIKIESLSMALDVFLYNGGTERQKLIFIPKHVKASALGYKVFAEALITKNAVRVKSGSDDFPSVWNDAEHLKSLIQEKSKEIRDSHLNF